MSSPATSPRPVVVWVLAQPGDASLAALEPAPEGVRFVVGAEPEEFDGAPRPDVVFDCWSGPRRVAGVLARTPDLEWLHSRSAGLEGVLVPGLVASPTIVTNGRGAFSQSLAEFVLAALLFFTKDLRRLVRSQEAGQWDEFDPEMLHGRTLGIVGYGDIGRTTAALLRPLWGRVHPAKLEQAAVFIPPALGAATVVALYLLAQRHFGTLAALIAGSILSVLSAHFWYSQVGFIDHHAAVALATTLLIAAGMALLARSSREPEGLRPARRSALAAGVCMGATLLLWPGSLLHVGLVEMGFLGYLLAARRRGHAVGFALRLVIVHAVAFCLLLPFGVASTWQEWGRFSPVVLSAFQPWYFGTATLFCGACAASWSRGWAADTRLQRCGGALGLGAVLLLASGAGSAARFDIGLVIASGMSIGTLFTLFIVPSMYVLLAKDHSLHAAPAAAPQPGHVRHVIPGLTRDP